MNKKNKEKIKRVISASLVIALILSLLLPLITFSVNAEDAIIINKVQIEQNID